MDERDREHQELEQSTEASPEPDSGRAPSPVGDDDEFQRSNPDSVARYYEKYYAHPYYSGPKKRGWPVWATVLIVVLVVMIGGCSVLIYAAYRGLLGAGIISNIPPAAVQVGTPLTWREIDSWQGPKGRMANVYSDVGLHAADFTGDGDDNVLIGKPYWGYSTQTGQLDIYDILNAQYVSSVPNSIYSAAALPWDYGGDGVMDIAVDNYPEVLIFDQAGSQLDKLAGTWQGQRPLAGDIDGNGSAELLLYDQSAQSLSAYDTSGTVIWALQSSQGTSGMFCGDIDGDGQDEVISDIGFGMSAAGLGQALTQINGWQPSSQYYGTIGGFTCADLNGDGTDEIIAAEYGYLDPASGTMIAWSWNAILATSNYIPVWTVGVKPYDLDGDGNLEIAVAGSSGSGGYGSSTALFAFDLSGNLVYYEEFGSYVHGLAVATAGGREHLCVLLSDRLIVYP